MRNYNQFLIVFSVFSVLSVAIANAFEPVSIDEFFKKYPDERPVQPTISSGKRNNSAGASHYLQNKGTKNQKDIEFIDQDIPTTAQKYPTVEVLLLDRILGHSQIIEFTVGETKPVNNLFDVTILDCLERKTEFGAKTQSIEMRVVGLTDSKADTKKKILYDDIFYVQMPGFKGFEHSIYDIRPIKCTGTPEPITLDEPIEIPADATIDHTTLDNNTPKEIPTVNTENNVPVPESVTTIDNKSDETEKPNRQKTQPETVNDNQNPSNYIIGTANKSDENNSENIIKDIINDTDTQIMNPAIEQVPELVPEQVPVPVPVPTE